LINPNNFLILSAKISGTNIYTPMKKEDLFDDEFLKQFKSGEELSSFLKQLQEHGLEKMLEGELDGQLDYEKKTEIQFW
jgi:uncharacterized protein (UPF0264 family)